MKPELKVLPFLKWGIFGMFLALPLYWLNIFICGYYRLTTEYAGPIYFFWSVKYLDKDICRSVYTETKKNEHPKDVRMDNYLKAVERKEVGKDASLYLLGLPDSFVCGVKTPWMIFKEKEHLNLEVAFLEMRRDFIESVYKESVDKLKKERDDKQKKEDDEAAKENRKAKDIKIKGLSMFEVTKKDLVNNFFNNAGSTNLFIKNMNSFMTIVDKLKKEEKDYKFTMDGDEKLKMSKSLEDDVMRFVNGVAPELNLTVENVNGFFTRLGMLKATQMDVHIRNRLSLLFFYTHSYIDFGKLGITAYTDATNAHTKAVNTVDNNAGAKKIKIANLAKRVAIIRLEWLLDFSAYLLANVMSSTGAVLNKANDKRGIIQKLGLPSMAHENNMEQRSDMKKIMAEAFKQ